MHLHPFGGCAQGGSWGWPTLAAAGLCRP